MESSKQKEIDNQDKKKLLVSITAEGTEVQLAQSHRPLKELEVSGTVSHRDTSLYLTD